MIPDGWIVFAHPSLPNVSRWEWYVSTGMGFVFASTRAYKTKAIAVQAARRTLNRFFSRFGEMP